MRARAEAIERIALKRKARLGKLSDEGYAELRLAVENNPDKFVEDEQERAFLMLADALDANAKAREGEDFLDDDAYEKSRTRRLGRLRDTCGIVLEVDRHCLDASTILALQGNDAGDILEELLSLDATCGGSADVALEMGDLIPCDDGQGIANEGATAEPLATNEAYASSAITEPAERAADDETALMPNTDDWTDVFEHPILRLHAVIAQEYLNTTRFGAARECCRRLVALTPSDPLGARFTWALACARLEDEQGFNDLDARFGRRGNAWSHIARTLLMFKLDRMSAARRALRGYASLCQGGAYALLRPTFVEAYLPDRPAFGQGTFEEACLAVHEADPVVVDTPDFIAWCTAQEGFAAEAQRYAEEHDLDW